MWYGEADLGEQLRTMTVTGTSPDGAVRATVTGENRLDLSFQPRRFEWYDEHGLAQQLSALGTTTWVAWTRQRQEILRMSLGQSREEAEQGRDEFRDFRDQEFDQRVRSLLCAGASTDGKVHIVLDGVTRWRVEIAEGSLRRHTAGSFTAETVSAFDALIRDRAMKMSLLKADHFDIGVPRRWLERARAR
ncbi:hypothetical protein BJY16_009171 [Actinoplanes octamycinicus]|uniref:Uncharacterized protein n=1 Tax=Actinoplanes octamycinicus TaxID=135948 RepID=A0A7W7MCZ6_9ACTN|nr:YbaB/EbfC family nucleoid-associated protein [Actinoplanes octamycinicus]MBB4745712.1 hypothetical protein [Actinoplanes octamycinicus]